MSGILDNFPQTSTTSMYDQTEIDRQYRLAIINRLRRDLQKIDPGLPTEFLEHIITVFTRAICSMDDHE